MAGHLMMLLLNGGGGDGVTPLTVEYLVVAGGGRGGAAQAAFGGGGGGGGGGVLLGTLSASGPFTVTVGGINPATNSAFGNIAATAGGDGGDWDEPGFTGGSGGGGGAEVGTASQSGGSGTSGQGNSGAAGDFFSGSGGGGGGASAAGSGRSGGAGVSSSITGSAVTYGAGGDGGLCDVNESVATSGDFGTANTGNGGGGAGASGISAGSSAFGGSGVVIVAYPDTNPALTVGDGLTYNEPTRSGYRVYRFTAGSGTVTFPGVGGGGGGDPPPELTGFAVSGAGTSEVNGTYCPSGTFSGKTRYVYAEFELRYEIDFQGTGNDYWAIWDTINFDYQYQVESVAETPPLTGWGVFLANSPAPTLSAASCP
jgi:hypothetical protein